MALLAPQRTCLIFTLFTLFVLSYSLSSATPTTACKFSFRDGNKLYNYTLSSPIRNFPHGILSEDGFYKVSVNQTTLWFQVGSISFAMEWFSITTLQHVLTAGTVEGQHVVGWSAVHSCQTTLEVIMCAQP